MVFIIVVGKAQGQSTIPGHPRDLKFTPTNFTPPNREQYRHVLSNGVVVYLVEDHQLPLVKVLMQIRGGSYLEPQGKEGVASLAAGQMRVGGTVSKTPDEFDEAVELLAANLGSYNGGIQGGAMLQLLSKDSDQGLALLFDMLKNPRFDEGRLKLAKSSILQGMERRNDNTAGIEGREFTRLMYGSDFFISKNTTKASIESITREDLMAFHRKYYHPGAFMFGISGDFNTKEMIAKLEAAMKGWAVDKAPLPAIPKRTFKPVPGVYVVDKPDVNQGRVTMGHIGTLHDNPDNYALNLMNSILGGGGFTSRIMTRVRSDEGLAYSAGSSFGSGITMPGNFRAACQSKSATTAQAIALIMEEIERIRTSNVTAEELDILKNSTIETFPGFLSSADQIAGMYLGDEFNGVAPDYWHKYRDHVKAVTIEDVRRVAQKYLKPEELVILVIGNIKDILNGNPDKPQYSLNKFAKDGQIKPIRLPDPLTMIYPQ